MKHKVLIVDDHAMIRDGVKTLISSNTNLVVAGEARTGQEALISFDLLKPDLVILDISLPDINGTEVAKEILRRDNKAKIIIFSMYDDSDYIRLCLDCGVNGYVLKNESSGELNQAISEVLQGRKYFSQHVKNVVFDKYTQATNEKRKKQELGLTNREVEIIKLVALGLTSHEIAEKLFISQRTVETHRLHVMKKLGTGNTIELIRKAQALHLC